MVGYFEPKELYLFFYKRDVMQLFSADDTMFFQKIKKKIVQTKLKKTPSNVAQKYSILFSPWAAKTAQTEEFMFQKCGL